MNKPLSSELIVNMNAYWRAANYLSVGQIYLYDNPMLKIPLTLEHVKPQLLGHWGTTPGLNFIYVHLNRIINEHDLNVIYVTGPGHGGPGLVANTYLEGTYSELYPDISLDEQGMKKLFTQFSFPGGIPSHVAPETPGSINEGGELGYTNRLVKDLKGGRALFTQPPMPIKCAGAPQKAMYLSCHRWEKARVLKDIDVQFHTAGAALFGVAAYVPALMDYVARYGAQLNLVSRLVEIDGPSGTAIFEQHDGETTKRVTERFDMIHDVPPQTAPDFVRESPLAAPSGFIELDEATLRHPRYRNVFALGDACSASNAKTAAAVRKQAPVVVVNALAALAGRDPVSDYDGYGSCPLTVEAGKIVLAEFGYGGKLLPTFPTWLIDGTRPSRLAWLLKDTILPPVYWHGMLKGREWFVKPHLIGS